MRKLNAQTDKEPNMWKAFADFAAPTNQPTEWKSYIWLLN